MSYHLLHEIDKRCALVRMASQVYGDEFIVDTSPKDEETPVAWNIRPANLRQKQAVMVGVTISGQHQITSPCVYFLNTPVVGQMIIEKCDWRSKKNPFTQADLLDNIESQVQDLIYRIRTSNSIRHPESYANRLLNLFNDAKEEDTSSLGIAIGSLRSLYNFLQLNADLKYPAISLTPDNSIYVSWRNERHQIFSVLFLPNENNTFVLLKPDNRRPEQQIRISGTVTLDVLIQTIAAFGIRDWICE